MSLIEKMRCDGCGFEDMGPWDCWKMVADVTYTGHRRYFFDQQPAREDYCPECVLKLRRGISKTGALHIVNRSEEEDAR
jgi:hypothetical protein